MPKQTTKTTQRFAVLKGLEDWFEVVDPELKTVKCLLEKCRRGDQNPFQFDQNKGWYKFKRHLVEVHKIQQDVIEYKLKNPNKTELISDHLIPKAPKTSSFNHYKRDDSRQVAFETALADYVALDGVPLDTPTRPGFKNLIATIDPKLRIPSRRTLTRRIKTNAIKIQRSHKTSLSRVPEGELHLSLDLWTSSANKSVLGIKAHFINAEWELKCFTASFKHYEHTKTGHNIRTFFKKCLAEDLGISPRQIGTIMADNASENIKAFDLHEFNIDTRTEYDGETEDSTDSDTDEAVGSEAEYNLEAEQLEEFDTAGLQEVGPIDIRELEIDEHVSTFERLGCTAHAVQLVLKEVVCKNTKGKEIVEIINHVVRFFHNSARYTNKLLKKTKLLVVSPGKTRWNSVIFALQRLLRDGFIDAVNQVLELARKENPNKKTIPSLIMPQLIDEMKELLAVLNPFIELTDRLQGDGVTSSCVIPGIIATYKAVSKLDICSEEIKRIRMYVCLGLAERFGASEERNYSGRGPRKQLLKVFEKRVFVLATLLDPRYKTKPFEVPLPEPYNLNNYRISKEQALNILSAEAGRIQSEEMEVQLIDESQQRRDEQVVQPSRSILDNLFGDDDEVEEQSQPPILNVESEINSYLNELRLSLTSSPLVFWRKNAKKLPLLSKLARRVLSVPASSGSIERIFSTAGALSRTRRAKLSMECLESLLIAREQKLHNK